MGEAPSYMTWAKGARRGRRLLDVGVAPEPYHNDTPEPIMDVDDDPEESAHDTSAKAAAE